jgi:hypothetical protein
LREGFRQACFEAPDQQRLISIDRISDLQKPGVLGHVEFFGAGRWYRHQMNVADDCFVVQRRADCLRDPENLHVKQKLIAVTDAAPNSVAVVKGAG